MPHPLHPKNENGQSMVEFAFVAPLLVVLLLAIAQLGLAYNQYLRLTDATRAGARKAAVSRLVGDKGAAAKAVVYSAADLDPTKMTVDVTSTDWNKAGSDVTVASAYRYSISIFGVLIKDGWMHSTTTERLE